MKQSIYNYPVSLLALFLAGLFALQSNAIIIRHDKGYSSYMVRENQYPAVFFLERQANRKVCVATLIHPQWAVTAAHCGDQTRLSETLKNNESYQVIVANRDRRIDGMVVHPDFQIGSVTEVDLAMLHFEEPMDFPAPVELNDVDNELGSEVTLLGWGFFGLGTTGRQNDDGEFRRAQNQIETAERRLTIRFDDPRELESSALELEGMPSLGDSGGPALLASEDGWVLAGIAVGELEGEDFSEETQGSYGSIAIYERILLHRDWILRTISSGYPGTSE